MVKTAMFDTNIYGNLEEIRSSSKRGRAEILRSQVEKGEIEVISCEPIIEEIRGLKRKGVDYKKVLDHHKKIAKRKLCYTDNVLKIAKEYEKLGLEAGDSVILAFAVIGGVDFLITENRQSMTKRGNTLKKIEQLNSQKGLKTPEVIPPLDFLKRYVFY